jgi:ASC-1-like (ASCH) protein
MPLFMTKKEVFAWLIAGAKTIDVRKGAARRGEVAVFQSGKNCLELQIIWKETGKLSEVVRKDNFRQIISTAQNLEEALDYLRRLYPIDEAIFTAYYLCNQKGKEP